MREGMGLHPKLGNGKACQQIFSPRYIQDKRRPSNYLKLFEPLIQTVLNGVRGRQKCKSMNFSNWVTFYHLILS